MTGQLPPRPGILAANALLPGAARTSRRSAPRRGRSGGRALRRGWSRRAFTLLEVIVAVTIVAILAALIVPNVLGFIGSSKVKVARSGTTSLANQVRLYLAEHEMSTPPSNFELEWLLEGDRPYLNNSNDLIDPWGNPYVFVYPPEVNRDFDIVSYGADGVPGGEGEAADIVSGGGSKGGGI